MRVLSLLSSVGWGLAPLVVATWTLGACSGAAHGPENGSPPLTGQTDFISAPMMGQGSTSGASFGGASTAGSAGSASGSTSGSSAPTASAAAPATTRTVQETDLYRVDGSRLYYLNSYRGLMVFDISTIDSPKFLGRSAIFGTPVDMVVSNGIATVIVADWFGTLDNGTPFHGSIVRGLDATDPTNIKVLGEAKLGGWVQDSRVVGNVLYAVSLDYGWEYGWGGPGAVSVGTYTGPDVIVSSVNFANGVIQQVASKTYSGYGGVFNVTPNAILLAHEPANTSSTVLQYLDISDPGGNIVERGSITVDGAVQGWGADNGRWNLDFADGKTAHSVGVYGNAGGYVLATVDFGNPDQPVLDSQLTIPSTGWTPAALFDGGRMYLSPSGYYSPSSGTTPLQVYDLSVPTAPVLAGQTTIPGSVWLMVPSGNQLFALGQDDGNDASLVSLKYLDVTKAATPTLIGTSTFGDGWAWTPAADTFKAFTHDPTQGLVVLPFSGWSYTSQQYNNGVQLIAFTPTSIQTEGAARTRGWVERGIFANPSATPTGGRILSLSDLALEVVDYSDPLAPVVTAQLTLARNVIASQPSGSTITEVSGSDWWGNDVSQSDVRVLPTSDAAENLDESQAPDVPVAGVNARSFTNAALTYVLTDVQVVVPCGAQYAQPLPTGAPTQCTAWQQQIEVVDTSNGGAKARGITTLPVDPSGWYWAWGGFYDCYYYDWFDGGDVMQVGADALALRRWHPNYSSNGQYVGASDDLYIVDLSNPDAPAVASMVVASDPTAWWGDMKVVGQTLYTTHYEWVSNVWPNATVRYYVDKIDLSDRAHPKASARINVPGVLVGGSQTDDSILYTIDYRWDPTTGNAINDFDTVTLSGSTAYLQSTLVLDGWVGNVFVTGNTAYTSTQLYNYNSNGPQNELHQIDLTNPSQPVDRIASGPLGWGWIVGVQGDRMLVTSGWGDGLDIYKLSPGAPPAYDQYARTPGWSPSSIVRQGNQLFVSNGDYGVETIPLN